MSGDRTIVPPVIRPGHQRADEDPRFAAQPAVNSTSETHTNTLFIDYIVIRDVTLIESANRLTRSDFACGLQDCVACVLTGL